MAKKQADIFPCSQSGCEYVGYSALGLSIHNRKAHGIAGATAKNGTLDEAVVELEDTLGQASVDGEEPAMFFTQDECEALWDAIMGDPYHREMWRNRYNSPHTTLKRALIELHKGMQA